MRNETPSIEQLQPSTSKIAALCAIGLSISLTLVGIELGLRLAWPVLDPHEHWRQATDFLRSQHPSNQHLEFRFEEGFTGLGPTSVFTTNNVGLRGSNLARPKPADEFRAILVGGSTMECLLLDDSDSIDAVLESVLRGSSKRRIEVYNAGKSGDRSDDHLAIISQRIMHLQPDLLVVFVGINDLRVAAAGHDYLHLGPRDVNEWSLAMTQFQVARLLWYPLKGLDIRPAATIRIVRRTAEDLSRPPPEPTTNAMPDLNLDAYRNNLLSIIGVAQAHGSHLVLMTQQTTWNSGVDPRVHNWGWVRTVQGTVFSEAQMSVALESLNDVVRELAISHRVPVYDVARSIPKSPDYFYDEVHFNVRGARVAAIGLAEVIQAQPWLTEVGTSDAAIRD